MNKYMYEAVTASGRMTKGFIDAESESDAKSQLNRMKLIPTAVAEQPFSKRDFELRKNRKLTTEEEVWIMRKLASYQKAGMPIRRGITALLEQKPKPAVARALSQVEERLMSGRSIADAFRENGRFEPLLVSMIEAGEHAGKLEDTLQMASIMLTKRVRLRQAVKSALSLPIAEGVFAILVTVGLIVFIVPKMAKMFSSLGAKLPGITLFYVGVANAITHYTIFVLIGLYILWRLVKLFWKRPGIRVKAELLIFRLPVIGELSQATATARVTTALAGLTESSVPLYEALKYASNVSSFLCIRQAIRDAAEDILVSGVSLATALSRTRGLPRDLGYSVATGEESGTISAAIATYADDLSEWVDSQLKVLTGLLEPIMTMFFAIIVGPVGIAIYLPTVTFGQAVLHSTGGHP